MTSKHDRLWIPRAIFSLPIAAGLLCRVGQLSVSGLLADGGEPEGGDRDGNVLSPTDMARMATPAAAMTHRLTSDSAVHPGCSQPLRRGNRGMPY